MDDREQFVMADGEKYSLSALENRFQTVLLDLHGRGLGVSCVCNNVKMAIHKRSRFFVYKTPNSGHLHAVDCPSYSEDMDGAEDTELVKLGFRLSKYVKVNIDENNTTRDRQASEHTIAAKILSMDDVLLRYYKESGLSFMKAEWQNSRGYGLFESRMRSAVTRTPGAWAEKLSDQMLVVPRFDKAVSQEFERQLDKRLSSTGIKAKMTFLIGRVKTLLTEFGRSFRLEQFRGVFTCNESVVMPRHGDLVMLAVDAGSAGKYSVDAISTIQLTDDFLPISTEKARNLFEYLYSVGVSFTVNVDHLTDMNRPIVWIKNNSTVISVFIDEKLRGGNRFCFPEDCSKLDLVLKARVL